LVLVDREMFRRRLFGIEFKPTNTMNDRTVTQAPAQAGIEDFNGIFQQRLRGIVREGLLLMFEVKLKSYSEVERRKGMFEEVLEAICHGASGSGVGKMLGVSASTVCEGWKARSKELLDEFRGRDLSRLDVVAMMVGGVFPGKGSCVVVALAIDIEGNKHLLDFEEGSSESAEVVKGLFARLHARALKVGTSRTSVSP
jgi:hypothetical protein